LAATRNHRPNWAFWSISGASRSVGVRSDHAKADSRWLHATFAADHEARKCRPTAARARVFNPRRLRVGRG
jgi:hypothetical protein